MPASRARLLIVDDEAAQMTALCTTLQMAGYETVGFSSATQALATLRSQQFDLLLTDMMMPEMDGIALLRMAFEIDPAYCLYLSSRFIVERFCEAFDHHRLAHILSPVLNHEKFDLFSQ